MFQVGTKIFPADRHDGCNISQRSAACLECLLVDALGRCEPTATCLPTRASCWFPMLVQHLAQPSDQISARHCQNDGPFCSSTDSFSCDLLRQYTERHGVVTLPHILSLLLPADPAAYKHIMWGTVGISALQSVTRK